MRRRGERAGAPLDILMLMLALMTRPSSLAHKLLMPMLMLMLASLVRTGL